MTGASRAGAILARHPLHAAYWSVLAPVVYFQLAILLLAFFLPDLAEHLDGTQPADLRLRWRVLVLVQFAVLVRACAWAHATVGNPFAGPLGTSSNWLSGALFAGPAVLIGTSVLIGAAFGDGEPDWAYRNSVAREMFTGPALGLSMVVYVVVIAPLLEEICFRGIAMGCLIGRGMDPRLAVLLTSLVFTALHYQYTPLGMLAVFIPALFLGWLRIASGTVSVPIAAHMAANAFSLWLLSASG